MKRFPLILGLAATGFAALSFSGSLQAAPPRAFGGGHAVCPYCPIQKQAGQNPGLVQTLGNQGRELIEVTRILVQSGAVAGMDFSDQSMSPLAVVNPNRGTGSRLEIRPLISPVFPSLLPLVPRLETPFYGNGRITDYSKLFGPPLNRVISANPLKRVQQEWEKHNEEGPRPLFIEELWRI